MAERISESEIIKSLKNVAKVADPSVECFAIHEENIKKAYNDIDKLLETKIIKEYHEDFDEAQEDFDAYGTLWYYLSKEGKKAVNKLFKDKKLSKEDRDFIFEAFGV